VLGEGQEGGSGGGVKECVCFGGCVGGGEEMEDLGGRTDIGEELCPVEVLIDKLIPI
jgi:hypothetical protein